MNFGGDIKWKLTPFPDKRFSLDFQEAPCWFWRFTQRLVLGFRWEKLK